MKVTNKNLGKFIGFMIMLCVAGTLAWELFELILNTVGIGLNLSAGPVGFDIDILSVYMSINPGSLAGLAAGWFLFRRV
ncbi:MAG: hypothetical protein PQJ61_02540 [Spirochaetales bacterium]|uniref:DUF4321 domain-containing protein n=1 Tax=Candidatus Thalassospirochaeta sargassi TaxID=3119039 RepID=A0AAJ1ICJ0_9SPIO|nr:hypothetical protein [Spirochaetales bacterium]